MSCSRLQRWRATKLVLLLLLAMVLRITAKDFWKSKPSTEWNEKETMKMLSDSPWTRTVSVPAGSLGGAPIAEWTKDLPNLSTTGGGRDPATLTGMAGGTSSGTSDSAPLYITWLSSVKIRQALVRVAVLRRTASPYMLSLKWNPPSYQASEPELKKFVEQPPVDYQIAIYGPFISSFNDVSLDDLKQKTFLSSKGDRSKKIALKKYIAPKDRTDRMAVFSFERQVDGKPVFGLEDGAVEFSAEGKKIFLKTSFNLLKMLHEARLDL